MRSLLAIAEFLVVVALVIVMALSICLFVCCLKCVLIGHWHDWPVSAGGHTVH